MVTMAFPPQFVVPLQIARHVPGAELALFGALVRACSNCACMDEPTGRCVSCPSNVSKWVGSEMTGSVATLELRRSLAIASAKLDRDRAEQTKYEAME